MPQRPNPADRAIFVEFFDVAVDDVEASAAQGIPVKKDRTFIRMVLDQFNTPEYQIKNPKESEYPRRFPDSWLMYQAKKTDQKVGTSLKALPWMTPAQIKNYENSDIWSVEQLAASSDQRVNKIMGGLDDRKKAKAFLEESKDTYQAEQLQKKFEAAQAQLDGQNDKIETLMKQNAELLKKLTSNEETTSKGKTKNEKDS